MPRAMANIDDDDARELHHAMVEQLLRNEAIRTSPVEAAFRAVPRHLFLPDVTLDAAYVNNAIPTKWIEGETVSAASQPGLVASMLEQLELKAGQRVLEIGAGTGYNAALLAHIVGESGSVISLDIDEDIAAGARERLLAAGFGYVQVICADGRAGYVAAAPYDRIILTVGATEIAPVWAAQLAPEGRLLLPLAVAGLVQRSVAFVSAGDHLFSVSAQRCRFMGLRPAAALPSGMQRLGPEGDLTLWRYNPRETAVEDVYSLLTGESHLWSSGVRVTLDELVHGLGPWLELHEPGFCLVHARSALAKLGVVPSLLSGQIGPERDCWTAGWHATDALCLLTCAPNRSPLYGGQPFTLYVRGHGDAEDLAERLLAHIAAWDTAQRPSLDNATFKVYPATVGYQPAENERAVVRGEMQMVLSWSEQLHA